MTRFFASASLVAASFVLAVGFSSQALAGDAAKETATAAAHAGMAGSAANIQTAQAHLHHAVNCLVGPKGDGFDASQFNPCAKDGDGAIPDSDAAGKAKLEKAVAIAEAGLKATDLAAATKAGNDTAAALK